MALQRALRRVFASGLALGLVLLASGTSGQTPAPATTTRAAATTDPFDDIFRRGAPVERTLKTVSASFVETSTSTLLKAPQVARGTLVGRRPNQVRLEYAGADARTVIVNGNTLAIVGPSRALRETRDISGTMRRAERFFVLTSPAELRKHFDITTIEAPGRTGAWQVTFTPRRKQMREGVSRVHLWIDQASLQLQALKMDYPGGDARLMEFSDVRINPTVDAQAFTPAPRR
jgi:outer membrane lipoprotein-sorting protein